MKEQFSDINHHIYVSTNSKMAIIAHNEMTKKIQRMLIDNFILAD